MNKAAIFSVGTCVPEKVLDNFYFENYLDTSDEWITKRTGIKRRHIWDDEKNKEYAATILGASAIENAAKKISLDIREIDTVICATFTPDNFFPSTACSIADKLGLQNPFAFDVSGACSGFIYALTIADGLIKSGKSKIIAVVGSEIISRTLDWNDRNTCILFGDGAGAVILKESNGENGIIATEMGTVPTAGDILKLPAWDGKQKISMNGREVFKHAVKLMSDSSLNVLNKAGLKPEDIDFLIPHQANERIIDAITEKMGISSSQIVKCVSEYGNTSSASIPIAFESIWDNSFVGSGKYVVFTALGGGITYGSILLRL